MILRRELVGFFIVTAAMLALARQSPAQPVEPYCCVCSGCPPSAAIECFTIGLKGVSQQSDCQNACARRTCTGATLLEGTCNFNAAACDPALLRTPAPALTPPVFAGLALVLALAGCELARRRRV